MNKACWSLSIYCLFFLTALNVNAQEKQKIDSLLVVLDNAKHDSTRIKAFLEIGKNYEYSNPDSASFFYNQGIALAKKAIGNDSTPNADLNPELNKLFSLEAEIIKEIGLKYWYQSDYDTALTNFEKSFKIYKALNNKNGIAFSHYYIGIVYWMQGKYAQALTKYNESLKIFETLADKEGLTRCYNVIGLVYEEQGIYDKALEYMQKSMKIDEEAGNKSGMSVIYSNIGIVHDLMGNYDEALKYYFKSLDIKKEIEDKRGMAGCYHNIGMVYQNQKKFDDALSYQIKSLNLKEELGDKKGIFNCLHIIGVIYSSTGNYDKAFEYYQKSLKIARELEDNRGTAIVYNYLAGMYVNMADSVKNQDKNRWSTDLYDAITYGDKAYLLATDLGIVLEQNNAAQHLKNAYAQLGNYKNALKYSDIYIKTRDSLLSEEKTKAVEEMEAKYENKKKEQQLALQESQLDAKDAKIKQEQLLRNALLGGLVAIVIIIVLVIYAYLQKQRANKILAKQKEEIEAQAGELKVINEKLVELDEFKENMTGMIVHDLKNPLNGIINIPQSLDSVKKVERMQQIGKQILNMVLNILDVHKYEETKMIIDKGDISLFEIAINAINSVSYLAEQKSISIKNNIKNRFTVRADKEILERVFVNILINAIKYTPNNGDILLKSIENAEAGKIKIEIQDSGEGIPADQLDKVFDKFIQVRAKKSGSVRSTGLGLTFCKMAVEAHGGEIDIKSRENEGTTIWFTLERAEKGMRDKSTDHSVSNQKQKIVLNESEKNILKPIVEICKQYEVYEVSALRNILSEIDDTQKNNIQFWKEGILHAVRNGNEKKYIELIEQAQLD